MRKPILEYVGKYPSVLVLLLIRNTTYFGKAVKANPFTQTHFKSITLSKLDLEPNFLDLSFTLARGNLEYFPRFERPISVYVACKRAQTPYSNLKGVLQLLKEDADLEIF
jgi:hypothetical protein